MRKKIILKVKYLDNIFAIFDYQIFFKFDSYNNKINIKKP